MSPCPWCGAAADHDCSETCPATPIQRREKRAANGCCDDPACDLPPRQYVDRESTSRQPTPAASDCGCLIEPLDGYFFTDQQLAAFFARTVFRQKGATVVDAAAFRRELTARNATPARRCSACGAIRTGRGEV